MRESLADFLSAGVETVASIGKGINKGKLLTTVLAAVIATNAVAQAFPANMPTEHEQLSLANYELVIQQKKNVVMDNPIIEGEVITFLFEKPTDAFLAGNFGESFTQSKAFADVKDVINSDGFYHSGMQLTTFEGEGTDANFTTVAEPGLGDYQSPSAVFQEQIDDFTFWHEVYHTGQTSHAHSKDTSSTVLMDETGADVFAAMVLAKKNAGEGASEQAAALEVVDSLINLRDHAGFGRGMVDEMHLTQPGLFILREAISEGKISPASMTLPAMKKAADDISVAAMQVDLSALVKQGIELIPARMKPATPEFFAKRLETARTEGPDYLSSLTFAGKYYEGAVHVAQHAKANPEAFSEMIATEAGLNAYAKNLSEMRGGANYQGNYDLTHPYAYTALKHADSSQRTAVFTDLAHSAYQAMDANGCFRARMDACMGADSNTYRTELVSSETSIAARFAKISASVAQAVERHQNLSDSTPATKPISHGMR